MKIKVVIIRASRSSNVGKIFVNKFKYFKLNINSLLKEFKMELQLPKKKPQQPHLKSLNPVHQIIVNTLELNILPRRRLKILEKT